MKKKIISKEHQELCVWNKYNMDRHFERKSPNTDVYVCIQIQIGLSVIQKKKEKKNELKYVYN